MLLTLILNCTDMAAAIIIPPPIPTTNNGSDGVRKSERQKIEDERNRIFQQQYDEDREWQLFVRLFSEFKNMN